MCRGVIDVEAKTQQGQEAQSMLGRRGGGVPDFCGFQRLFALFFRLAGLLQQLPETAFQHLWPEKG